METTPLTQTVNLIGKAQRILLLTHARADGDGLSSILALRRALVQLGKEVSTVTADPVPAMYRFLPGQEAVVSSLATDGNALRFALPEGGTPEVSTAVVDGQLEVQVRVDGRVLTARDLVQGKSQTASSWDLVIVCDTAELPQLGKIWEENPDLLYENPTINIDHHTSNTGYGRVNLVDTTAASTTEIITRLLRELGKEANQQLIDADTATLLLTGLTTDTGSFQHSNTTPRALEVAADLIELGARQQEIIQQIFKTKPLATLKLWGNVLSRIQSDTEHRLVWSSITAEDLAENSVDDEAAGAIIDELMTNAPGAEVVLLLKAGDGIVRGSLRTTTPAVSASDIASLFGGGGHLQAAGFRLPGETLKTALPRVLEKIRAYQASRPIPSQNQPKTKAPTKPNKPADKKGLRQRRRK